MVSVVKVQDRISCVCLQESYQSLISFPISHIIIMILRNISWVFHWDNCANHLDFLCFTMLSCACKQTFMNEALMSCYMLHPLVHVTYTPHTPNHQMALDNCGTIEHTFFHFMLLSLCTLNKSYQMPWYIFRWYFYHLLFIQTTCRSLNDYECKYLNDSAIVRTII